MAYVEGSGTAVMLMKPVAALNVAAEDRCQGRKESADGQRLERDANHDRGSWDPTEGMAEIIPLFSHPAQNVSNNWSQPLKYPAITAAGTLFTAISSR